MKLAPLVIVGTGDYAEAAHYFLRQEDTYNILGFTEELSFISKSNFVGLPIFEFEKLAKHFNPEETRVLVAVGPNRINTVRERLFKEVKEMGFSCIRYVHPKALVCSDTPIGENSFIFPGCIIEPFASVGSNSVMWSGSILAHHSVVGDHCFIAPGTKISGRVVVKNNCFLGINSTIRDNVVVEEKCLVGGGAVIKGNTVPNGVYSAVATPIYNCESFTTDV